MLAGKFWMPLTYCFLHGNFQHILFNSLAIYFIGKLLEPLLSTQRFLVLYLGGALCGGALWMAFNWGSPYPLVGASAASMALLMCYCLLRPNEPVTLLLFFIIPLTVKPKWIIWGTFAFEVSGLLLSELQPIPTTRISHSAHIGGALWGLAFCFFVLKGQSLTALWRSIHIENPRWTTRRRKLHVVKERINRQESERKPFGSWRP